MNDDIIKMAEQVRSEGFAFPLVMPEIRRLCELVRADEREACAKVADRYVGADPIADAIRARGNA